MMGSYIQQEIKRQEPPSPQFHRSIYSQIEEVGWDHLLKLEEDLSSLSFRVIDEKGRPHILEIALPQNYPDSAPSISADVPYICELEWSKKSKLKDILRQFSKHLRKLQDFWSTLDEIDKAFLVVDHKHLSHATENRLIGLGNDCYILLHIDAQKPRSLPECRFLGQDLAVNMMRKKWRRNGRKWTSKKPIHDNLVAMLETALPRPIAVSKDHEHVDCGICYAQYLPIDDELRANSGSSPDYTCDNSSCSRVFHSVCLRASPMGGFPYLYLVDIDTFRSFDVLFGNCPYCSEPVAVKVNSCK